MLACVRVFAGQALPVAVGGAVRMHEPLARKSLAPQHSLWRSATADHHNRDDDDDAARLRELSHSICFFSRSNVLHRAARKPLRAPAAPAAPAAAKVPSPTRHTVTSATNRE